MHPWTAPAARAASRPSRAARRRQRLAAWLLCLAFGCGSHGRDSAAAAARSGNGGGSECPARARVQNPLPGVAPEELTLDYWLARYTPAELDAQLMDEAAIAQLNQRVGKRMGRADFAQRDLRVPLDGLVLAEGLRERLALLRPDVSAGKLVGRDGQALQPSAAKVFDEAPKLIATSLRVMLQSTLLRCGPYDGGLYKAEVQLPYDRNACGPLPAQEAVELLGKAGNGMWLVRSRYSFGFIPGDAPLSGPIPPAFVNAFLSSPRLTANPHTRLAAVGGGDGVVLEQRTNLATLNAREVALATKSGFQRFARNATLVPQTRALTRRALLTEAFANIDQRYGLGGTEDGLDCSGLLLNLFETFDIPLTRYSGWQAEAGAYSVDVHGLSPEEKLKHLDAAAHSGAVLLYFPGHIMLYLGRSKNGTPRALHALGEYADACPGGGETVVDVQRVVVSGLDLGKGTSRTSFLERLSKLVVFGPEPAGALKERADLGPAAPPNPLRRDAPCSDSADHRIFISPAMPLVNGPLRAIAASSKDPGSASLRVFDSDGDALPIDEFGLGGPPWGRVARAAKLNAGVYTVVLGTGDRHIACKRVRVHESNAPKPNASEGDPYWVPRDKWARDTEALYSLFVEQLFAGPPDDEQTWTNLHSLLRDPSRNLLYDHLGLNEESRLEIVPDCADLPYSLRAYMAWKMKLPYAYRQCSRGRAEKPPRCGELKSSLQPRKTADEVAAFSEFVNRGVRWGVHSATGRTHPDDSETDLYPVALDRNVLTPGTVYADPYGHVMMISKWFAQGSIPGSPYGVLMAAEAQPDGTIGRRRFWQGSFLFDPSTISVGAGFKRFRPLEYDRTTETLSALDNAAIMKQHELPRWSHQQYDGDREAFYDRMDELINPHPLAPGARLQSLVDALDESARRRVLSVDNGEQYAHTHPQQVIPMPAGGAIFETEGAWEDFATPSRDMRLLIAIDTVTALPARIEQKPERFALPEGTSPASAAQSLREALDRELHARSLQYTRSDGSTQTITLADVVARAAALEMAYNPNDCAEVRWGAPEGSPERSTCTRSAPDAQKKRMASYRTWFHTRTRPARGE
jgi:hypothetical protein